MERREFIAIFGVAAAWPLAARAQQGQRVRRVGALMKPAADDPVSIARAKAFSEGLQALGWVDGGMCRSTIDGPRASQTFFSGTQQSLRTLRLT